MERHYEGENLTQRVPYDYPHPSHEALKQRRPSQPDLSTPWPHRFGGKPRQVFTRRNSLRAGYHKLIAIGLKGTPARFHDTFRAGDDVLAIFHCVCHGNNRSGRVIRCHRDCLHGRLTTAYSLLVATSRYR